MVLFFQFKNAQLEGMMEVDAVKHDLADAPALQADLPSRSRGTGSSLQEPSSLVAQAYDGNASSYMLYADGLKAESKLSDVLDMGARSYSDKVLWAGLKGCVDDLRAAGKLDLSVLDVGCGPATWAIRLATYSKRAGFAKIKIRGFDISAGQIELARAQWEKSGLNEIAADFSVADLSEGLPESDRSVDLVMVNYTVLNHIPAESHTRIAAELSRVTRNYFFTTVRAVGSVPTTYVDQIKNARHFQQHFEKDQLSVELSNGASVVIPSHLFTATELEKLFADYLDIQDLRGLDIWLSRFGGDSRWTAAQMDGIPGRARMLAFLETLEERYCREIGWRDHGNQLLLIGRPKRSSRQT